MKLRFLFLLTLLTAQITFANSSYDDCSNIPSLNLTNLRLKSESMIEKLQDEVNQKLQKDSHGENSSELNDVLETLSCMRSQVHRTPISCNIPSDIKYKEDRFMFINTYNYLVGSYYEKKIYYAEKANSTSANYQAALLVHELSHLCGTKDIKYGTSDAVAFKKPDWESEATEPSPRDMFEYIPRDFLLNTDIDWTENADHYRAWSLYGFCVPGEDCLDQILTLKRAAGLL